MFPFEPEPAEVLRGRFPAAVEEVLRVEQLADGTIPRPAGLRKHVFDFPDGLRLVIARENGPRLGEVVHLTAAVKRGTPAADRIAAATNPNSALYEEAWDRFLELSGGAYRAVLLFDVSGSGTPHWYARAM